MEFLQLEYLASYLVILVFLATPFLQAITYWRIFKKAGRPGWAALIPIYNIYVFLKIVGKSGGNVILYLIPFANIVYHMSVLHDLAKSFGVNNYTIFFLVYRIAFGKYKYTGPNPSTKTA